MSILRKSRILCIVMILALVVGVIAPVGSFTAFAGDVDTYGDFTYSYSLDEITILSYNGSGGDVVIPSTINGYPVVAIDDDAFKDNDTITSVDMPSVMIVGYGAFYSCDELVSVNMPSAVTLCDSTFSACTKLTTVNMPSVEIIGYETFDSCYSLENVDIPNVKTIDWYGFYGCSSLESVNMPGIESVERNAFNYCSSLTSFTVGDSNPYFSDEDGILFNKNKTELVFYPIGKTETSYTVPDSVTTIGENAFCCSDYLESVSMPNVRFIEAGAFQECAYLKSVDIPKVTEIMYSAFYYCEYLEGLYAPNVYMIDSAAFSECIRLEYVVAPKLEYAYMSAFYNCESLVKVDIPMVEHFDDYVFTYCHEGLTLYAPFGSYVETYAAENSINFVDTYAVDGDYKYYVTDGKAVVLFYNGLDTDIEIPSTLGGYPVAAIGKEAFCYNYDITSVYAPSVTDIYEDAFYDCEYLVTVDIPNVINLAKSAFDSCYALTEINMPNVEVVGYEAFDYCYSLESVDIPKATMIETYAFYDCYALTSVNAPNVVYLGNSVFYYCRTLVEIDLPQVSIIDADTFMYCSALENVNIPKAEIIGEAAFFDCYSLTKIIMPNVQEIVYAAFAGCPSSLTMYGYSGTFVEEYANNSGFNFVPLSDCAVTFHNGDAITTQMVAKGECAEEPTDPEKAGQSFLGWYTEDGEYFWFDTPITDDIDLYAKFGYYITIYLDRDDDEPTGWLSVEAGQCANVPAEPGKDGKVFVGWYTAGGTKYDFSTPVTESFALYAKFVDESPEWVKSVSHVITDGKIIFTVVTSPGEYNRVKLAADDNRGGYIAYTNNYTINPSGDYVWTIKANAPTETTSYVFDARSASTNKYLKSYFEYTAEVVVGVKSVSHQISGGKIIFTVVTGAGDYNRVKAALSSNLGGYVAYTNSYVNVDGDYVWTIKADAPTETVTYAFDIRSASTSKYLKDYFYYDVEVEASAIKSVTHQIVNTQIVFTVVTTPGNFTRIKVTSADNLGGSLGVAGDYVINSEGDYVWTVKATAPTEETEYAFDLRSGETNKYMKEYYNYLVDYIPVVKAIDYTISNGKIYFTVITAPGDFARMKVTTADNLSGSLGVATTYTINGDGNYVWLLKAAEPTEDTTYAFDLRDAGTGKYMKDYYYCDAEPKQPTIVSVNHEIVGSKVVFTVVTAPGSYDRIKLALASNLGGSLAVATSYTVDGSGNYVWTIKAAAPSSATTYALDLRSTVTGKYMKDYGYYDVE